MRNVTTRVVPLATAFLLLLAAPGAAKTWTVQVKGAEPDGPFRFVPALLSIAYGDTVKWVWVDGTHTTTNHDGVDCNGGLVPFLWREVIDAANPMFSYVFAPPAVPPVDSTYFYECELHCFLGMNGSISVQATGVAHPPLVPNQAPFSWGRIKRELFAEPTKPPTGGE
jgi:plastocyanin